MTGTPKGDDGSDHTKPSSSHSDSRSSIPSRAGASPETSLKASAKDVPGAFPGDNDNNDIFTDQDPASIDLPESLPDEESHATYASPAHLDAPGHRKRKRAATDLPSQVPQPSRDLAAPTARARPRSTRERLLGFLTGKHHKAHDDSDKENKSWRSVRRTGPQHFEDEERESKVLSVLRERNQKRRPPKHLQSSRWRKTVSRPALVVRPTKRPRFIPARTQDAGEESEDELAAPQVEEPKVEDSRKERTIHSFPTPSLSELRRRSSVSRLKHGDINSLFDEPDVISMPSLTLSNGMQKLIEETRRIEAEQKRKREEEERKAREEKERKLNEERLAMSGGLRIPKQPFVVPVAESWQRRAYETLSAAPNASLAATAEGTELRRHDFAKVVPATVWLNDEIVNGALLWLDKAINSAAGVKDPKKQTRKCLALSSFFWKRMVELQGKNTQRTLRRFGVEQRNFLDVDTILLPICESSHWTLVVVRPTKRTIAYMDSMRPNENVAHFKRYTNLTLAWLKDVLGPKFEEDKWKVIRHDAPQQNNGYDCGVFTITNAMCVALGLSPIDSYREEDMPAQRIRIACMLLNNGFSGDFDLKVY